MARIVTLEDGDNKRYKVIVEMGRDPRTGRRRRRTKTFKKQRDANSWMGDMITARDNGTAVEPSKITVGEFLDRWLENHKKPKIAASTYDRYKNKIDAHLKPSLGAIPLQELEPYHIETYFANKRAKGRHDGKKGGLSENTLKKHYVILNSAMKRAIKLRLIKYNPVQAVESPQPEKKEAPVMTEEEYNKLLKIIKEDTFMFTFVMTALLTGMRRSEILGLEWSEVDLDEGVIEVKKRLIKVTGAVLHENKTKNSSSRRKIKISEMLVAILKKHKAKQAELQLASGSKYNKKKKYVFCRPDGKNYTPKTLNLKLNYYLDKAGLPQKYTIHTLRHSFATTSIKKGVPPETIQKMLGHSTISTTIDIYHHVNLEMQKEAVDKLEKTINLE